MVDIPMKNVKIQMLNLKMIQMSNVKLHDDQHLNDGCQKDLYVHQFDVKHSNDEHQSVRHTTFEC